MLLSSSPPALSTFQSHRPEFPRRDLLLDLPPEIFLHIISFIHDPKTLIRCCLVSRYWFNWLCDEEVWKTTVKKFGYEPDRGPNTSLALETQGDTLLPSINWRELLKREFSIGEFSSWLCVPVRNPYHSIIRFSTRYFPQHRSRLASFWLQTLV